jgi:NADPH:quinone reductase-like Zn-dependent oxidoreductase
MKSYWIHTRGRHTELECRDLPIPDPGPEEIVLRVHAAGLNRGELFVGGVMHGGAEKPGGTEAAGTVHAIGSAVRGLERGQRIMGRVKAPGGGFSEYVAMRADQAIEVPERLSWEQAASIPVTFLVTYDMLYPYGRLAAGEWLLVTGASSGVGVSAIQTGKFIGAHVIGTSGSAPKLERLRAIGLDAGIRTRAADFAAEVRSLTRGQGANVVVNCVGGSVFPECMRALAHRGRLATVGYVDGVFEAPIDLSRLHAHRLELFGVSNSRLSDADKAATVRGFKRDLLPAFASGAIEPLIDRVFDFDELPAAKAYMESDAQVGKIVARIA